MARLPPDRRDRAIAVIEALCAGHARLDGTLVAGGLVIRPVELLAAVAASGSQDRFPAMTVEAISKAVGQPLSVRTYSEVALAMLVHWPRIQIIRDEDDALDKLQREEASADAAARRRADQIAVTKAEREARKQAKQALRAAA
jgi:hypothetical protein